MSNRIISLLICFVSCLCVLAQNDRDHVRRGNRLTRDTLYQKAQVEYQKAIEADNTNAIAHYNLGNAFMYQNKAEDALKEFDTASKFERNKIRLSKIYHNMGVLLQSAKQYDKALAFYQNSLRNNPACNGQDNNDQQQDKNEKNDKKEQDKQNKENQNKEDKQNQKNQQEEQKPDMSKENAEQMLKAAMQDEKSTQEKMQRALQQPQRKHLQKQW